MSTRSLQPATATSAQAEAPSVHATATNPAKTVSVQADDYGLLIDATIADAAVRAGAAQLRHELLILTAKAARAAAQIRRRQLAAQGLSSDVLDRLGLGVSRQARAERRGLTLLQTP